MQTPLVEGGVRNLSSFRGDTAVKKEKYDTLPKGERWEARKKDKLYSSVAKVDDPGENKRKKIKRPMEKSILWKNLS